MSERTALSQVQSSSTGAAERLNPPQQFVADVVVPRLSFLVRVRGVLAHPVFWLLLIPALVIVRGITSSELYFYGDEMRHAMNGAFFRDLMVDFPIRNPMRYALEYYAKYPAIAVGHWPPLFHIVEGVFFLVFGVSVVSSKLCVLGFSLLGLYFWYRIAEMYGPKYRALISGVIFALLPHVLLYERSTMLEIPSVAGSLAAIFFWLRFLEHGKRKDLWMVAAFASASFLISQKALFLVVLFALHWIVERRFRLLLRWDVWAALACSLAVVVPWYALTFRTLVPIIGRAYDPAFEHMFRERHLTYYPSMLPRQLGWLLLSFAVIGVTWVLLKHARRYRFLLLWVAACYICFTFLPEKNMRHTIIWLPPLVYFALYGVELLFLQRRLALVAQTAVALVFVVGAAREARSHVRGVENAAVHVLALPESEIVYYQGELDGNFVFLVRKHDPQKMRMVARDKQIVVTQILYDQRQVLHRPEEVVDFFRTWGIRYAMIESGRTREGLEPVRAALESEAFELVRKFPIDSDVPRHQNKEILLYRFRGELQRSTEPVVVPMMTIRRNIRVRLNRLAGQPWPN